MKALPHDLDDVKKIEKELKKYRRPFLKASEVARLLGVSQRLIHYYCNRGEIFAIKLSPRRGKGKREKGGSWLIYKESLIEFLLRRNNYEVF